jgi:hypothetical protein
VEEVEYHQKGAGRVERATAWRARGIAEEHDVEAPHPAMRPSPEDKSPDCTEPHNVQSPPERLGFARNPPASLILPYACNPAL